MLGRPALVLAAGVILTVLVVLGARSIIEQREDVRMHGAVQATEDRIVGRFDSYLALMFATRSHIVADGAPDTEEFARYAEGLALGRTYPGIQGLGFSRRFAWAERARIEEEMRAAGSSDFRVWPDHERVEGHAIVVLEPRDARNRAALGFDMFTEPARREAMERARDTGEAAASGRVTLVQEIDANKQPGFLVYVPVYEGNIVPDTIEARRQKLVGFVYAAFRAGDLFAGIFGREARPRVGFSVHDARIAPDTLLYAISTDAANDAAHSVVNTISLAGRTWQLSFWSLPTFEKTGPRWVLWLFIAGGLSVTALVYLLARTRARASHELQLRSRILDSMTEGVSLSDENGIILYTNPAEDRMFGYARGELVGKPVTVQNTYPPEENQRIVDDVIAQLRERGSWTGEFSNIRKDRSMFTTRAHITALELDAGPVWVCVQEDVTERKRAEAERASLLEREQAANRTKDEFLAVLGHELRNPLSPIVTALELLRQQGVNARELAVIDRQVRHLKRMVDDLLDVSAIARGKVALATQPIEIRSALDTAIELAAPLLEERAHSLTVEVPSTGLLVDGDEARLVQVFSNLLVNAAKYTDPRGTIALTATRDGDEVVVRVRDNGIGMDHAELGRVFQLFSQGERRVEHARGGLGIGLSLARSLVELHGGAISAASEGRGHGTEVTVRLPASGGEALPRSPRASATDMPRARKQHRVLLVDDNTDAADLLADLLRDVGHTVTVAYDAAQALAMAAEAPPDIAILDIGLPVMDGYELGERLARAHGTKLIALTGYGREHDRTRSTAAGFAHHLVKPVSPTALLRILDE